jgi:hypothetical protein
VARRKLTPEEELAYEEMARAARKLQEAQRAANEAAARRKAAKTNARLSLNEPDDQKEGGHA